MKPLYYHSYIFQVHYNAWQEMADEPFDSSRLRGRKHVTKLGSGDGIFGFDKALSTMKKGKLLLRFDRLHVFL